MLENIDKVVTIIGAIVSAIVGVVGLIYTIKQFYKEYPQNEPPEYNGGKSTARSWKAFLRKTAGKCISFAAAFVLIVLFICTMITEPGLHQVNTAVSLLSIDDGDGTAGDSLWTFNSRMSLPIASNSLFLYAADVGPDGPVVLTIDYGSIVAKVSLDGYERVSALHADEPCVYAAATYWMDGNPYFVFLELGEYGSVREISEPFQSGSGEVYVSVADFFITKNGTNLWYVEKNENDFTYSLKKMSRNIDTGLYEPAMDGPEDGPWVVPGNGLESELYPQIAMDTQGALYISATSEGCILRMDIADKAAGYDDKDFAGKRGERVYNDKTTPFFQKPTFYEPGSILVYDGFLYVLDGGVVRRLQLEHPEKCYTLAGTTQTGQEPTRLKPGKTVRGVDMVFPISGEMRLAANPEGGVLLSNPNDGVIYLIQEN